MDLQTPRHVQAPGRRLPALHRRPRGRRTPRRPLRTGPGGPRVIQQDRENPIARGRIRSPALQFWATTGLLAISMFVGLLVSSASLPPDLREGSNDLSLYRQAGESILR